MVSKSADYVPPYGRTYIFSNKYHRFLSSTANNQYFLYSISAPNLVHLSGQTIEFDFEIYFDGIRYLDISPKISGYGYNIWILRSISSLVISNDMGYVLSSHETVLSTQHQYMQCPCLFFILERYKLRGHKTVSQKKIKQP